MMHPPTELKAMSFNIRFGTADDGENSWLFRRDAVIEFLATCGCSVIGLQEVLFSQLREIQHALPYFHWVGVAREDGLMDGEYSAILYDSRRIHQGASETFWFSETPDVIGSKSWGNTNTRICTHGSFELNGHPFEVYNLHIDHESAFSRIKSIELLLHRIQARTSPAPTIVTGDFNEGEGGPAIELMAMTGFEDTYRTLYPDGPEQATYHGWNGRTEGEKIDYVFVSNGVTVVDATIIRETPFGRHLSDHYPVVATIEL